MAVSLSSNEYTQVYRTEMARWKKSYTGLQVSISPTNKSYVTVGRYTDGYNGTKYFVTLNLFEVWWLQSNLQDVRDCIKTFDGERNVKYADLPLRLAGKYRFVQIGHEKDYNRLSVEQFANEKTRTLSIPISQVDKLTEELEKATLIGECFQDLRCQENNLNDLINEVLRRIVTDVRETIMADDVATFVADLDALKLESEDLKLPMDYMLTITKIVKDFDKHLETIYKIFKLVGFKTWIGKADINPVVRLREQAQKILDSPENTMRRLVDHFY